MFSGKCLPAISKALAWSLSLSECSEPSKKSNLTFFFHAHFQLIGNTIKYPSHSKFLVTFISFACMPPPYASVQ